ncbi:MAG: glutamine synthetase III [Parachlamydiaceae bacterium]
MLFARYKALEESGKRSSQLATDQAKISLIEQFGAYVFDKKSMQQMLSKDIFANVVDAMELKADINPDYADAIAIAMKEWAISHGATHYTHWFQPLTGTTAEKHDTFLDWSATDLLIEQFSGKQLLQGEPDASSFPSGGLRSTYEARGYTGWDPTSPVFLWKAGDGFTLCIPSVFFSWTGEVLDTKIPFLRSEKKISEAASRLLKLTGVASEHVYSTLGIEQEYFVIDRAFRNLRPDLILLGKTVYGAASPKGQELQDHYLGSVRDRVLLFMRDFENEAIKLGIPIKTRHNEVAPAQYEVAPVFEKSSLAIDHNVLLMELMRHIAIKHELSCLLLEKPFQGMNGSGKHCNWSLSTNSGINLLDPSDTPGNNLHFLILMTAVIYAIHKHATLIRASIGSYSNDDRLGGHEAPPAILSIYLGAELEAVFQNIEQKGGYVATREAVYYDLGLKGLPNLLKDNTDRNRTSPFAFTGNKFEFRAVGSSAHPAFPITVLNAIVAESLSEMLDEIETKLQSHQVEHVLNAAMPVIQKYLKASKDVRFSGDNYSEEWGLEAHRRGLPNIAKSFDAFSSLNDDATLRAFTGILTQEELKSRYAILKENYFHMAFIELNLMLEIFQSQILPSVIEYQRQLAESIDKTEKILAPLLLENQKEWLADFSIHIEKAIAAHDRLKEFQVKSESFYHEETLRSFFLQKEQLRQVVDRLEKMASDSLWPLPKYRELLFIL